ncbi:MAG: RDD family protein [Sciscionella sp.]
MSRWTGEWLPGVGPQVTDGEPVQRYRGERLGLPEEGVGALASLGQRFGALFIDLIIAGVLAALFVHASITDVAAMQEQNYWGVLIWFLLTVIAVSLFGFTPGQGAVGIRVTRLDGTAMVGPLRTIPRTVLIALLIPVVIWDRDHRGLHDKLAGTVVLRMR